jgi:hypothetical protein
MSKLRPPGLDSDIEDGIEPDAIGGVRWGHRLLVDVDYFPPLSSSASTFVLALPGKPYRLAFPPPLKVPSEGARDRPADSFRCAAYGDVQIRVRCLLKERFAGGQEFRGDVAGLICSSPGAIDVRDADPDAPDPSAETAEGKIQPPLNV